MDLLDRYLYAVRGWLPADPGPDLVAELADDLRSQIEEREDELGRKLDSEEVAELLRRCGHPIVVAGKLLPGPAWLEPALWAIYRFVLRVVLVWVLPAALLLAHLPALLASHDRALELLRLVLALVRAEIFALGLVTVVFYLIGRKRSVEDWQKRWDPRRLPRVRDARRIPRADSAAAAVVGILFLGWWSGAAAPLLEPDPLGRLRHLASGSSWGTLWETFHAVTYWPVLLFSSAGILLSLVALARPYWTPFRLALHALVHVGLALTLGITLVPLAPETLGRIEQLRAVPAVLSESAAVESVLSVALVGSIAMVVLIVAVTALVDFARIARWSRRDPEATPSSD